MMIRAGQLTVVACLAWAGFAVAADSPHAADSKPGKRVLFNGKNLEGWKKTNYGGEGDVRVEEGALILDFGSPLTGVTWTGEPLPKSNYVITLKARRVRGTDFFCGLTFPVGESHCSLILGGWGGSLVGLSSINEQDASENATTSYVRFETGKWYDVKVEVTDSHIKAWLDDEMLCNVERAGNEFDVRLEVEPNKPLGLCTFETTGAIKNVVVHPIAAGAIR